MRESQPHLRVIKIYPSKKELCSNDIRSSRDSRRLTQTVVKVFSSFLTRYIFPFYAGKSPISTCNCYLGSD